tara:strand:- start:26 stop:271 length:246 start_codon:yes stop_codon:yes gene_type:complete
MTEQITNDEVFIEEYPVESIEEKYNKILQQRREAINKYHKTQKGIASLKASSSKYYLKHKAKILAKKREKYRRNNPLPVKQ